MMPRGKILSYKQQVREAFDGFSDLLGRIERGETTEQEATVQLLMTACRVAFILTPAILDELDYESRHRKD